MPRTCIDEPGFACSKAALPAERCHLDCIPVRYDGEQCLPVGGAARAAAPPVLKAWTGGQDCAGQRLHPGCGRAGGCAGAGRLPRPVRHHPRARVPCCKVQGLEISRMLMPCSSCGLCGVRCLPGRLNAVRCMCLMSPFNAVCNHPCLSVPDLPSAYLISSARQPCRCVR